MTIPERDTYPTHRFNVSVPDLHDFQRRYEQAVPVFPAAEVGALVEREAPWDEMLALIESVAPNGFLIYWHSAIHDTMRLADDNAQCFAYLMGNHTIAERMYRYDPRAMLYAPLRTTIWEHADGTAWFSIEQPSSHFSSLAHPEITKVGLELDQKVAALLELLEVEVPSGLR